MRSGICPKCESNEVYAGTKVSSKLRASIGNTIPIRSCFFFPFSRIFASLDNYVCGLCGYVERYIADTKDLDKIKEEWPRVPLW